MVQYTAQTWRNYFWLCVGLAAANLVLLYFFCPESNFRRPDGELDTQMELQHATDDEELAGKTSSSFVENVSEGSLGYTIHLLPLKERLHLVRYDTSISFLRTLVEPLRLLRHPSVLWTIYAYGCSLSPQIIMMYVSCLVLFR
jgi:hypothetical protein